MSPRSIGLLQVVCASVGFGFIGVFSKKAFAAGVTVGELVTLRFAIASLLLGFILLVARPRTFLLGRRQITLSLILGIVGYAVFATLYLLAIQGLSVALAVLLLYTFPFWTFVINIFLGERPSKTGVLGLAGALGGLAMLLFGELRIESALAVACGIGAAVSYSVYVISSGRLQKGVAPLGSGFWIITGAALALAIFHRPEWTRVQAMGSEQWMPLLGLAGICTVIPLVLIQGALQRLSSTETAILSMTEPVTASIAAALILGEKPTAMQAIGGTVVLGSLLLVTLKGSTKAAS